MKTPFLKIPVFKIQVTRREYTKTYFAFSRQFIQKQKNKILDSKTEGGKEEHWQRAEHLHKNSPWHNYYVSARTTTFKLNYHPPNIILKTT